MRKLLTLAVVLPLFAAGCSGQTGGVDAQHPDAGPSTGEGTDRHTTIAEFTERETSKHDRTLPNTAGPR